MAIKDCICGKTKKISLGFKEGIEIVRCQSCNTIFPVTYNYSEQFYRDEYSQQYQIRRGTLTYQDRINHDVKVAECRFKSLQGVIKPTKSLDIGSGTGGFVKVALGANYDAYGIELMSFAVEDRIINDSFLTYEFQPNSFGLITMFDVLEHFDNPFVVIRKVLSIIQPKGILVIEQPNPISEEAINEGILWKHIKPQEHNYLISDMMLTIIFKYLKLPLVKQFEPVKGRMCLVYRNDRL